MSYDGNGNWTYPPGTPGVSGNVIASIPYNALLADLQTSLTKSFLRDGQSAASANLSMGGFKFTGLAAGATAGDSVRYEQAGALALAQGAAASGANVDITSLKGTATNDDAAVGKIGEYLLTSVAFGARVLLADATPRDLIVLSLGAGDWDVQCHSWFLQTGGTVQYATTCTSITSGATNVDTQMAQMGAVFTAGTRITQTVPIVRFSCAAATTIYMTQLSGHSGGGTVEGWGHLRYRRVR